MKYQKAAATRSAPTTKRMGQLFMFPWLVGTDGTEVELFLVAGEPSEEIAAATPPGPANPAKLLGSAEIIVLFCETSRSVSDDAVTPPGNASEMPPMVSGAAIASTEEADAGLIPACELMAFAIDEALLPSTAPTILLPLSTREEPPELLVMDVKF